MLAALAAASSRDLPAVAEPAQPDPPVGCFVRERRRLLRPFRWSARSAPTWSSRPDLEPVAIITLADRKQGRWRGGLPWASRSRAPNQGRTGAKINAVRADASLSSGSGSGGVSKRLIRLRSRSRSEPEGRAASRICKNLQKSDERTQKLLELISHCTRVALRSFRGRRALGPSSPLNSRRVAS